MEFQGVAGAPLAEAEARMLSPLTLAYIGDAVYEVYVRARLLARIPSAGKLHAACVRWVSAAGQEKVWFALEHRLSEDEAAVARRGRNARTTAPTNTSPATYGRSTALEALVGYLYITGRTDRIRELLDGAFAAVEANALTGAEAEDGA